MTDPDYVDGDIIHDTHWLAVIRAIETGDGIITGSLITPQGTPNMTVDVSAGKVVVDGYTVTHPGTTGLTLTAPTAGNRKWAMITVTSGGAVNLTYGAETTVPDMPSPPDLPSAETLLGFVWLYDGITAITATEIRQMGLTLEKSSKIPDTWIVGTEGTPDEDYTCDGSADDVQINAAITDAYNNGGGTVILKENKIDDNYKTQATIILKDYVTLTAMLKGETNHVGIRNETEVGADNHNILDTNQAKGAVIENIALYAANQNPSYGVLHVNDSEECVFRNLKTLYGYNWNIIITEGNGNIFENIHSKDSQSLGGYDTYMDEAFNNKFINCRIGTLRMVDSRRNNFTNCYEIGNGLNQPGFWIDKNLLSEGINTFQNCDIYIDTDTTTDINTEGNKIIGCHLNFNPTGDALRIGTGILGNAGDYNVLMGNSVENSQGFEIAGNKNIMVGNTNAGTITDTGSDNEVALNT